MFALLWQRFLRLEWIGKGFVVAALLVGTGWIVGKLGLMNWHSSSARPGSMSSPFLSRRSSFAGFGSTPRHSAELRVHSLFRQELQDLAIFLQPLCEALVELLVLPKLCDVLANASRTTSEIVIP